MPWGDAEELGEVAELVDVERDLATEPPVQGGQRETEGSSDRGASETRSSDLRAYIGRHGCGRSRRHATNLDGRRLVRWISLHGVSLSAIISLMATGTRPRPPLASADSLRAQVAGEVRALMARQRISGSRLAVMLGESQKWVSRRTTGEVPFDVDDLERIASALDVGVHELLQQKPTVYRHAQPLAA